MYATRVNLGVRAQSARRTPSFGAATVVWGPIKIKAPVQICQSWLVVMGLLGQQHFF